MKVFGGGMVVAFEITTAQFSLFRTGNCSVLHGLQEKETKRIKDREHSRKDY